MIGDCTHTFGEMATAEHGECVACMRARVAAQRETLKAVAGYLRAFPPERCRNCRRVPVKFSFSCERVPSCRTRHETYAAALRTICGALPAGTEAASADASPTPAPDGAGRA